MTYRFTRIWAGLMIAIGVVFIGLGIVLAGVAMFTEEWRQGVPGGQAALERALVVSGLVLSGVLAGSPFIVFGQLLRIFLDQRRLLARIYKQLASRAEPRATPPAPPKEADRYPKL